MNHLLIVQKLMLYYNWFQCAKRHFEICPAFEKGSCSRGKYCPYPHPKSKTVKPVKRNLLKRKPPSKSAEVVSNTNLRYFEDTSMKKEDKSNEKKEANTSNGEEIIHPKRPRLGRLPSFIPLSFDKSFSEYSHEWGLCFWIWAVFYSTKDCDISTRYFIMYLFVCVKE